LAEGIGDQDDFLRIVGVFERRSGVGNMVLTQLSAIGRRPVFLNFEFVGPLE
jgi:hypothetical protein